MKRLFTVVILLFFLNWTLAEAQRGRGEKGGPPMITVKGKVVDGDVGSPLEFATLTFFSKRDSSIKGGGITDLDGNFSLETPPDTYAKVEFIGYQTRTMDIPFEKGKRELDLGTIPLLGDAAVLSEVEVVAEKSTMQISLDKKVFNVGKDLSSRGGSAEDILDNVPSVEVDVEGNVTLRGSSGVRIFIDGKPSGLIGNGNTNGLRAIPANLIEKVEVITNPSARYEAEGTAGIINIVLKKDRKKGINGSFDLTFGIPETYGAAINMNFRRNKLNFFLNYGIQYRTSFGGGFNDLQTFNGDSTFLSNQSRDFNRSGINNSIRFGADYNFSEKSTLTTGMVYRFGEDNNDNEVIYRDFLNNDPLGVAVRKDDEFEDESNLEYFVTHTQKFKEKGHELTTDVRFSDNVEVERSDFTETYFDNDLNPLGVANLLQRSRNDEGNQQLQVQVDYVKPLGGRDQRFELGLRSSLREIRNDYLVEEFDDVNWKSLEGLSNDFIYDEGIHSLYAIYGNKIKKFSYQVGVRGELTDLYTELEQTNEVNDTMYAGLFPSVFLGYEAGNQNSFQISYSRRLRRPRFWDLNPFFTFSDARNFFSGNPKVGPENTDSYELSHIKYWGKGSLTTSIYYRYSTDVIERITFVNPDGTSITQPQNLSTQNDFGLEFTYNFQPYKWWRINGNFNFFRSITDGGNLGESFAADTYSWFSRITSQTTVWKDLDVQVRGNYRAPRENTQGRSKGIAHLDLALSKDVFNKNGSITFSVRDVFNSRKRAYIQEGPNFIREGEFQWRARTAILTINYRLNQKKQRGGGRSGNYDGGGDEF